MEKQTFKRKKCSNNKSLVDTKIEMLEKWRKLRKSWNLDLTTLDRFSRTYLFKQQSVTTKMSKPASSVKEFYEELNVLTSSTRNWNCIRSEAFKIVQLPQIISRKNRMPQLTDKMKEVIDKNSKFRISRFPDIGTKVSSRGFQYVKVRIRQNIIQKSMKNTVL